jgi:hypothetical protein
MTTTPATDPLRFAYWAPNVSAGLVTGTIEQRSLKPKPLPGAGLDPAAVPGPAAGLTAPGPVLVGAR